MKRTNRKKKGVVKGAPSGFVISLLVHVAAFMLAGLLVVFNVVQKDEKKFVPPEPVSRPKMKLKKPQVTVKKNVKPKSSTRIVTKVQKADMPDIKLPEMSGMGGSLGDGVGAGFNLMTDLAEVTMFGSGQTIGNDFVGKFYDLKRNRKGEPKPLMDRVHVHNLVAKFVRNDWRESTFLPYYCSPSSLYTTMFMVPPTHSGLAPKAFGEIDADGYLWLALYKGQLVYHEDIEFRFWGRGDDILTVRVDGEIVLEGSYPETHQILSPFWNRVRADSNKYPMGFARSIVGDWIELKAGEPLDMEVLLGEIPGGVFFSMLCVEVKGVEYPHNALGNGPTLPAFMTEEPSQDLIDVIEYNLVPGEASLEGGPVFKDYTSKSAQKSITQPDVEPVEIAEPKKSDPVRLWTMKDGKTVEGEFLSVVNGKVTLKNRKGRPMRLKMSELSAEDQEFIELTDPPAFNISFLKNGKQVEGPKPSPLISDFIQPYRGTDYVFGAEIQKKENRPYNHELTLEYFVYADESDGKTFRLMERNRSSFTPSEENGGKHVFYGKTVRVEEFSMTPEYSTRGTSYGGYLILLYDKRGEIIQYKTSSERLYRNLEKLKQIPVGKWMDKNCDRVGPPRPGTMHRPDWMS